VTQAVGWKDPTGGFPALMGISHRKLARSMPPWTCPAHKAQIALWSPLLNLPGSELRVPRAITMWDPSWCSSNLSIRRPHPLVIEESARSGLFSAETTAAILFLTRDMRAHDLHLREDAGTVVQFLSTKTSISASVASVWTQLHRRYQRKIRVNLLAGT
jgi:hypothetical protein